MKVGRRTTGLVVVTLLAGCGPFINSTPVNVSTSVSSPNVQLSSSIALVYDRNGGQWAFVAYSDWSEQPLVELSRPTIAAHTMGLAVRDPGQAWTAASPQLGASLPVGIGGNGLFAGSTNWISSAPGHGSTAYYVTTGQRSPRNCGAGDVSLECAPGALYLSRVDVSGWGASTGGITLNTAIPPPVAVGNYDGPGQPLSTTEWYEPTVAVARPPGSGADTVVIAACDGDDVPPPGMSQGSLYVWVSNDGATSFRPAAHPHIFAPGLTTPPPAGRTDTLLRPFLRQDPRPGHECTEYLTFVVDYPSALANQAQCQSSSSECNAIAESTSADCGDTWSSPVYIAHRIGVVTGANRSYAYAIGDDGVRYLTWMEKRSLSSSNPRETLTATYVLSSPPDAPFADDSARITVVPARANVQRRIPAIAAARGTVVITLDEVASGVSIALAAVAYASDLNAWSTFILRGGVKPTCTDELVGELNAILPSSVAPALPSFLATWTQLGSSNCNGQYNVFASTLTPAPPPEHLTNACHGTLPLEGTPNGYCADRSTGQCGAWRCVGTDAVTCDTTRGTPNSCQGCAPMPVPGTSHGFGHTCFCDDPGRSEGHLVCSADRNHLLCCPCSPGCGPP